MSFGYDAAHALSTSVANIDDAAISLIDALNGERQTLSTRRRPVVFIAHSLGGIVVKKASRSSIWRNHFRKLMISRRLYWLTSGPTTGRTSEIASPGLSFLQCHIGEPTRLIGRSL
jgi:hypothetical protein